MDNSTFSADDRVRLQETHDGVIRLLQWKDDFKLAHEKFENTTIKTLKEHSTSINALRNWRWYVTGMIVTVSVIIGLLIEFRK